MTGVCGIAAHAFHTPPGESPGYANSARVVRNYSAVTGACMMTRREVFEQVGGFNVRLPIDFNDVDYCLRVGAAGLLIVYTPYAQLIHLEAGTLGRSTQNPREVEEMERTWGFALLRDPYYNPNLTTRYPDFRLGTEARAVISRLRSRHRDTHDPRNRERARHRAVRANT